MKNRNFLLLLVLLAVSAALKAQPEITMADAILKGRTALAPANLRALQWIPGADQFTYVVNNKLVRQVVPTLDADTLDVLSGINEKAVAMGIPALGSLPGVQWLGPGSLWFQNNSHIYTFETAGALTDRNHYDEKAENVDIETTNFNAAYTVGNELRISSNGKESLVAKSEADGIVYGKSVHREEFGIYKGTFWSPSSRYLAFYRMDERMVTQYPIYVLDSMPAQQRMIRYPFAGSKSHHVTLGVYDTQNGKTIYLKTGEPAEQYLTNIAWTPDDKYILIAVLNREQNHLWLKQFDARSGEFVKTIFEETNDKYVEPEHPVEFVPGSKTDFIWQSERDGYNQIYRYNLSGKMLGQLSAGAAPVVNFYGFSKDGSTCFYQTADDNGLSRFCYAVASNGSGKPVLLTPQGGSHNILYSNDGKWLLDNYSSAILPRRIILAPVADPMDRKIVYNAANPIGAYTTGQVNFITLTAADGTTLNGRLILPTNFDVNKKYPAIVYVYNGPHVQLVSNTWMGGAELWMHHMAQEGYAVFTIDGHGSANRGFAFESAIHRHVGDLEIQDQVMGANYLKSQPFIDSTRLGVFGWSYGGFMATSLMTRPEAKGIFKCGVAGGPVIDWRMYEIMYTERYMDTPQENPDGYEKASLFNYIDNLNGRLLMIHGSSDNVVLWQHSLRYIRECVRKNKQIDYFVYPEHEHNVLGKDRVNLFEKIDRFFNDNL